MRKRTYRRIKRAVFVACEGKSELGYVRWLNRLADAEGVPVSIMGRDMKGGGAGKIADRAARALLRSAGGPAMYDKRYLLMDRGSSARYRQEIEQARQIAGKNSFSIIWQPICHECFLLKHFAGTEDRNHPDASACEAALLAVWPAYRKGLDATEYEREILIEHLVRARANLPELEAFLIDIGWG